MTDIWKLPNGNYNLRRHSKFYLEFTPNGLMVCSRETLPADAVPMVPATGRHRQVTGQELYEARYDDETWARSPHVHEVWNAAAERLNLRVRDERQPWDVLREAADAITSHMKSSTIAVDMFFIHTEADRLEAEAKEKSQRDREIEAGREAFEAASGIRTTPTDGWIEAVIDALDAVRGEQA